MKIRPVVSLIALAGQIFPSIAFATAIGISTVEQPVNLVEKSNPTRIPLGKVGVISNHDYGIHRIIGEARPCPDGAMLWAGGSELDQNLASVFGLSVEAEDPTQISAFPVTLRLKPWKPPEYSPYSKEQVLAATLWCLLRSTGGTPEQPLDVRVVAEGKEDLPLVAKYSRKYVTRPGKDGKEVAPVKVPETLIQEDTKGVAWVVFPAVAKKAAEPSPAYGLIVLEEIDGEGDPGWHLLPVWGNGDDENESIEMNTRSAIMCYSSWHSKGLREANSFFNQGGSNSFTVTRGEKSDSVSFGYSLVKQETLAADILALVVSSQPTEAHPLTVSFMADEHDLARYPAFRSAAGWKESRQDGNLNHAFVLECQFVWDATTRKLLKGTVPCVVLESPSWIIPDPSLENAPDGLEKKIAQAVESRIKAGIHDGTLLAEANIARDSLAESGLRRQIGLAGYYEALAAFSNGTRIPDKPVNSPLHAGNSQLDQLYRAGWVTGINRAQSIANEIRKELTEAGKKAEKPGS